MQSCGRDKGRESAFDQDSTIFEAQKPAVSIEVLSTEQNTEKWP